MSDEHTIVENTEYHGIAGKLHFDYNEKLHRIGGPAIEYDAGFESWFLHGHRHRIDGPAYNDGEGHQEWWIDGVKLSCKTQEEFLQLMKMKAFW